MYVVSKDEILNLKNYVFKIDDVIIIYSFVTGIVLVLEKQGSSFKYRIIMH